MRRYTLTITIRSRFASTTHMRTVRATSREDAIAQGEIIAQVESASRSPRDRDLLSFVIEAVCADE